MPGVYAYTPTIWLPLVAAIVVAAMGLYAWHRREVPAVKPFVATLLFGCLLVLGVAAEAAAVTPAAKIAWNKCQLLFTVLTVTGGTCFSLEYAYPGRWLTRRNLILLSIVPLLTLILIVVNDARFMWREFVVEPGGAVISSYAIPGAVALAYSLGLVLVNAAVFVWLFIRSPQHHWPVAIMLVGQFAGRVTYLLNFTGVPLPTIVDPTTLAVLAPATAYFIALFGFRIFDPLPAARRAVIEQMRAVVVVFDATWHVASLNPVAEKVFGIRDHAARGKTWQQLARPGEVLLAVPDAGTHPAGSEIKLPDMALETGAGARYYAPALSPLRDFRGPLMGHLLMLSDVTEQRRAQAQVLEQQRSLVMLKERELLARELHDSIGQVLGYASFQVEAAGQLIDGGQAAPARAQLSRLAGVLQEAHADLRQQILDLSAVPSPNEPFPVIIRRYLEGFASNYDIQAQLELAGEADCGALAPEVQVQLLRILQEALSNARRHSGARQVQVQLERANGALRMSIEDDGCGFDPDEPILGGGHFGLDFMRQRAVELGGGLRVESGLGAGTRVVVEIPYQER